MEIVIVKNFNSDLGKVVWTIQRQDGGVMFDGAIGFNYDSQEMAAAEYPKVVAYLAKIAK